MRAKTTNPKKTKCATKYCRRTAKHGSLCYKCQHEQRKKNSPYRYWYGVLRRNARRRGKKFALTFEYWVTWCDDTGYLALKGRHKHALSVDCQINDLGYVDGNIRPLLLGENARKGTKRIEWNYITNQWDVLEQPATETTDDLPF